MFKLTLLLLATVTLGCAQETLTEDETINLDLSNRSIESLNDYNFSKLKKLESVDLSYNDLTFIGDDTFRNNPKLKTINLAGNPRLKVPEYSTFFISNVENLNLSHCNIDAIYENSFDGLLNLKIIDLSYNPIKQNGISFFAIKPLKELREIIVSHPDGPSFEEICQVVDLTIVVKSESNNLDIKCDDVRVGKLEAILPKPETKIEAIPPKSETILPKSETKIEANVEPKITVPVVVEKTEAPPVANEHVIEQNSKEESGKLNTTQVNQAVEENIIAPDVVPLPETNPAEKKETEPKNEDTETRESNLAAKIPIEGKPKTESETKKIEESYSKVEESYPKGEVTKINNETAMAKDGSSKSAKSMLGQETDKDGETKIQQSESSSQPAAGTTVLVILVIAAVVGGLAAFGYKYYKSGQDDEKEPMEKELQEITIDSKPNGAALRVENEPLIHQRKHSVEIKEVDEAQEDQNKNTSSQNGSSYIPITTVEKVTDEETDNNQTSK